MPYAVKKVGTKYKVIKKDDGAVMGTHPSPTAAQRQIAAIYANEKSRK